MRGKTGTNRSILPCRSGVRQTANATRQFVNTQIQVGYIASNGVWLAQDDTMGRAVELLQETPSGAVPVMEDGYLRGLVSDREIARGLARSPETRVSDVMTQEVPIAPAAMPAGEALNLLSEIDFPALPVVLPDGRFLGTIGRAELLKAIFRRRRPHMVGGMGYTVRGVSFGRDAPRRSGRLGPRRYRFLLVPRVRTGQRPRGSCQ